MSSTNRSNVRVVPPEVLEEQFFPSNDEDSPDDASEQAATREKDTVLTREQVKQGASNLLRRATRERDPPTKKASKKAKKRAQAKAQLEAAAAFTW